MPKKYQKWTKSGQKWPKMVKNGQKWPKMTKNGQKWPIMAKNKKFENQYHNSSRFIIIWQGS